MRHTITIFKWEMRKIITNWRKTLVVFLLPAVLLLAALNVFPMLINYLSTGHLQSRPVTVVGAPEYFRDFVEESSKSSFYTFTWMDEGFEIGDEDPMSKQIRKGEVVLCFYATKNGEVTDFDKCVHEIYYRVANNYTRKDLSAEIGAFYDHDSYTSYLQAEQFRQDMVSDYQDYLFDALGEEYQKAGGGDRWLVNDFNPVTFVMDNRATANSAAARSIPAMMILLMYYCIYSLSGELMASSRESGFLTKVYLTPISEISLLSGKLLNVVTISTISSMLTYLLLFISSWINRTNSAFSLLPFGLFLTPKDLLLSLITLIVAACMMSALCFGIVFKLRRMEDVILNLQVPLVLLILEFFALMFRPSQTLGIELVIPIHNSMMLIRDIFIGRFSYSAFAVVTVVNLALTAFLLMLCVRNTDGMIHISQGGKDDNRKWRK